ncbi:hypothetical protein CP04DC42_0400 [Chlamydia psittaci 04DC42]|nr:hypothetical protein CP02DC16_0399 [Chlamydia psittaci 02DC16]EPJ15815.1 hypothetical protein CP02DC18_0413 [Chlamydia psittaci 02DC18]EPJ17385.1 hypothetical protein CP02DC22_0404 [Chlamydia psittaci 02DC22]EPJ18092.1 hypothetical protein CP01DC11_0758 [Chlamydia psittaci 01DC11]EPJ22232.1 hypothetical protein CP04DC42_0400 [Chlamydia psittaci 04DC42]EPJ23272.1 hypothetical protein CP08DC60_1014 [Chlamydia psittaci 08DC60]EPJ24986.1 hypothetical protein CP03DC29_0042 [Chlamydia psittaci 0
MSLKGCARNIKNKAPLPWQSMKEKMRKTGYSEPSEPLPAFRNRRF